MAAYNYVALLGNLTRDPEIRYAQSGLCIAKLGLAVNERTKRGDEYIDETTFVDITLFGKTAEIAGEHLSKGSQCLIEGRLKLHRWEQDGQKRQKLEVNGNRLVLLGAKPQSNNGPPPSQPGPPASQEGPPDDDIPF